MKLASRQEKRQILLALLGLLFACFSASLIILYVVPRPTTTTVIAFSPEASKLSLQELEKILVDSSQTMMHGHRRLMAKHIDAINDTTQSAPVNSTEPSSAPSISSSGHPTLIVDEIFPILPEPQPVGATKGADATTSANTVPAVMVGLASAIIVLAALLYAHDIRDRFRETTPDDSKSEAEIVEGDTTSAGSTSNGESGYWINTTSNALVPYPMLPPIATNEDGQANDDLSIAHMSTLTGSNFDSHWSFGVEDKLKSIENSSCVTELSDEHLVPVDISGLSMLIKKRKATDDGSSFESDDDEEALLGETCLDSYEPLDSPRPSFEYTPDSTPGKEERDATSEGSEDSDERMGPTLKNLDHFMDDVPFEQMSIAPSVVRDIYFVPGSANVAIGLALDKHDYPIIANVDPSSPLVGRVFIGDSILSLNDIDGMDFSAEECMTVLEAGLMVKLTVQSIEPESASDDGSSVVDLDDLEGAVEV